MASPSKKLPYRTHYSDLSDREMIILWPTGNTRRRKTTVYDYGVIHWKSFGTLHVGIATYDEAIEWTDMATFQADVDERWRHQELADAKRSWWRGVGELQRFVP